MQILISVSLVAFGIYSLIDGELGLAVGAIILLGIFALFLATKITLLEEKIAEERREVARLQKKLDSQTKKVNKSSERRKAAQKNKEPEPLPDPEVYLPDELEEAGVVDPETIENYLVEEDPTPKQRATSMSPHVPPKIITRTSTKRPLRATETWNGERTWDDDEIEELLENYRQGKSVASIAINMRLDQKDIAYKLTRLNFDEDGDLEDLSDAPNNGLHWDETDSNKLNEMNFAGITLSGMARILGRTKLAIGWRLADAHRLNRL